MHETQEIVAYIDAFLAGEESFAALRRWLNERAHEAASTADPYAEGLADQAWLLVVEHFDGLRSDADLRMTLADLVRPYPAVRLGTFPANGAPVRTGSGDTITVGRSWPAARGLREVAAV
ncbi:MAG TPA: hypothetical protein VG370_33445 [Chloroflexota bacterium]|jgi:hypothetical protein|nr:hypothetical protein [Chloroflexota bacterium]